MSRASTFVVVGLSLAIATAPHALAAQDRSARERLQSIATYELALGSRTGKPAEHAWNIARTYAQLGNRKQALRWLGHALDMGFTQRDTIRAEPAFAPYWDDERYQAIMDGRLSHGRGSVDPAARHARGFTAHPLHRLAAEVAAHTATGKGKSNGVLVPNPGIRAAPS